MSSTLIGKSHNAHLDWLLNSWMVSNASPVCFLEGFSGTGKTTIARVLLERAILEKYTAVMITAPVTKKDPTDDLLLDLATVLNAAGRNELANAIENNRPLLDVLSVIVNDPILIIVDEFQNTMHGPRSIPMGGFAKVLSELANRKWLKGRFLLLTNRLVERARWSEPYAIRTLKGLDNDDGLKLLEILAKEGERIDEIDLERRRDIIELVGGNPRAIRTIVNNLAYDSIEELIGNKPELWEIRDRKVSSELVEKFEEELLQKTLSQLPDNHVHNLKNLSVIRKPFKRQAIELLFGDKVDYARFRNDMVNRFLMEQYKGWFTLHPIVREIGFEKLSHNPEEKRKAHAIVAPYYMRHFKAKQIVGWGALGGHFVEARFHLISSGKEEELREVASRFQSYIFSTLSRTSPIPKNPEELDERIAVLSSLLENPGPKPLEYHLARLFQARNQRNDLRRALHHANRSKSDFHVMSWLLCSDLLYQMERREDALSTLKQGIKRVRPEKGVVQIYDRCAQLLYDESLQQEAIDILRQGIAQIPPDKAVVNLYERYGRFLYQMGKREEAIRILEEGMERIPPNKALVTLYTLCGTLLSQAGEYDKAIKILTQGIDQIPPNYAVSDLYFKVGELLLQIDRNQEAVAIFKEGIDVIPSDKGRGVMYARYGELLYQSGELENAIILIKEGINSVPPEKGALLLYLYYAKLLLISNQHERAIAALIEAMQRVPANQNQPIVELLLVLYAADQNESGITKILNKFDEIDSAQYITAKVLMLQVRQAWGDAAKCAEEARNKNIQNGFLKTLEAFSWLCSGYPERGIEIINNSGLGKGHVYWLKAFIYLRLGDIAEAKKAVAAFHNQTTTMKFVDEALLLKLWDTSSSNLDQYELSYYYPILPFSITGINQSVCRIPFSPPVLSGHNNGNVHSRSGDGNEQQTVREISSVMNDKNVFISHSSVQKSQADDLHYMLEKAGFNPILDVYDIEGGQNIPERIAALIKESKFFVLLLTEESLKSSWVLSEITLAYSYGLLKEERLLPVQLSEIDENLANSVPWIPRNSYSWLDGTHGMRSVVDWLESK